MSLASHSDNLDFNERSFATKKDHMETERYMTVYFMVL